MNYARRRNKLRKLLEDCDCMLVTNETNVRYLTGFTGDSSYLIVSAAGEDQTLLVSDPRYEEQIAEQCPGLPTFIRKPEQKLMPVTCDCLKRQKPGRLKIEGDSLTVTMWHQLQDGQPAELVAGNAEVERLRAIKDASEIALLETAVHVAERAFQSVRSELRPGLTERQVAHELEHRIRSLGGEGCSFAPIVAVGPRAALPHAVPGQARIDSSGFVLIDWGATLQGYRSDLTRVLLTSKIPAKISRAYTAVLAAQQAAIEAMKPGVAVSEIDDLARGVIAEAGMAKRFNHGLGHGIGLDIHEAPRLGKDPQQVLAAGMVVTVEPGVYYPGLGGIRIEDDILITPTGARSLSSLPRDADANAVEMLHY